MSRKMLIPYYLAKNTALTQNHTKIVTIVKDKIVLSLGIILILF